MQERIKVCQVSSVHKTFDTRIYHKICKSLVNDYEVIYVSANAKTEVRDGIQIVGVPLPTSRLKRVIKLNRIYHALKQIDATIYQIHDPELILVGLRLKRKGKLVIFDSHEDVPQQILDKEYLPRFVRKKISAIYTLFEKITLKKYDAVITVTPTIVERLSKINPNCSQITNYPIIEDCCSAEDSRAFENKICFFGGVTSQWCQHQILKAIEGTTVEYIFAGPLDDKDYLKELEQETGYKNAEYLGVIKRSECLSIMQKCAAGIALSDYTGNMGGKKGTLGNNKLFEYMLAGIPVIATDFQLWKEIISRYDCGTFVNPYDINDVRKAILFYTTHPDEARRQGDNGRKAVEMVYNWRTQKQILYEVYKKILYNGK